MKKNSYLLKSRGAKDRLKTKAELKLLRENWIFEVYLKNGKLEDYWKIGVLEN